MKKLYFLIFSLVSLIYFKIPAQSFDWVKQFRSIDDKIEDIKTIRRDSEDNIYLLGKSNTYSGFDADPSDNESLIVAPLTYSTGGEGTVFIVKLDKNGNFIWGRNLTDISFDTEVDLKILNDKVFVVSNKTITTSPNSYGKYATISILDSAGNFLNKVPLLKGSADSFEIDENENIYLSGKFASKIDIYNPNDQNYDINTPSLGTYVIKFDKNLRVSWTKTFPNSYDYNKILKNNHSQIVLALNYNIVDQYYEIYKFNYNGNTVWKDKFETQFFRDFTINSTDEIIIAGNWSGQFSDIDVDPSVGQYFLPSNTYNNNYVIWLNSTGKLIDVKPFLNDGKSNIPFTIESIVYDSEKYFINGYFSKSFDADPSPTSTNILDFGTGYNEGMSIFFDKNHNYIKSLRIGSKNYQHPNSNNHIISNIYIDKNYYFVGKFDWNSNFNPDGSYFLTTPISSNVLNADIYLLKLSDCSSNPKVESNSPICPNSDINLQAFGGATYLWTGPNNFKSTDQNPTIPNATAINSGTYSCKISGTGDCDGTFTVDVKVEDKTAPVPNIANLQDISGDCKTIVSVIPTATDACAGNIVATTKSPLQYSIPGTYVIVWDYDDGNGNISHQNQNVIISSPALPTANATQQFCSTENRTVADLQITGQNVKWYDETGSILDQNFKLIDGNYYASQIINGCESDKIKVSVKINVTPLPTADANQDFCSSQNAKISDLKVTGTNLKFYDSAGNSLANSTLLQDNSSYFVTQTVNSCESEKFEIKVVISQNALPANDFSFSICNDTTSNTKTEDLTKYQDNLIANSSTYIFEYFDHNQNAISDFKNRTLSIGQNIFNVKVSTNLGCFKIVQLTLQLNEKPKINLPETAEFCAGKSVELDAGFNPNYSYEWSSGEKTNKISINQEGTYTVKVTSNFGCENTASTVVKKSLIAEILKVEITNNNAKVILSASGDFEYSLDNKIWQDSNEFKNLANGNYTVYVRTKLGCIIGVKDFSIFNISNTFTPNGDGKNDTWKIDGLENYPNSEVSVYDATGKRVLFKITSGAFEWDGKLNSRNLPTATYWYNIKVSDGRILNGYLLLKNRN